MKAWAIYSGAYYRDGGFDGKAFRTKKSAKAYLRSKGFKFNKAEELFLNDDVHNDGTNIGEGANIEKIEFINR